jgi:hypothetical protein
MKLTISGPRANQPAATIARQTMSPTTDTPVPDPPPRAP